MREHFDLDPNLIYLNSGSHSLTPRVVTEAVTRYQRQYNLNPTASLMRSCGALWEIQKKWAAFFSADPNDMFLRPNVTLPLNDFIMGAPMPAGKSEILMSDLEYGAIMNICELRAERSRLTTRKFRVPSGQRASDYPSPPRLTEKLVSELRPETGILVLSHVITSTGLVWPLAEIARETRARGITLIIDGAHAPGAVEVDFSKWSDVDYYAGNGHKWLMGPKGTAFAWVNKRRQRELPVPYGSWTTYTHDNQFKDFGADTFARQFLMPGCYDFAPFYALSETLDFWKSLGAGGIRRRMLELQNFTEDTVTELLGWRTISPPRGPMRGPLLAYEAPPELAGRDPLKLMMTVAGENGLQVLFSVMRDRPYLRLTPHIYNTEDEIRRAVKKISGLLSHELESRI